jgi:DNA-binding response OmpR family regulator
MQRVTTSPRSSSSAGEPSCVLIVDGDKVSQRAIELALTPNRYLIEWARDGLAALDIMRRVRVDVIVADAVLSDMPGITLVRRTIELCGPGSPAFLFVSAERATTTKVGLLMVGATDYMIKPFVADELRLRVHNMLAVRQRARAEAVRGIVGLAGDATQVPVPDILTMLELTRKTGTLYIAIGPAIGRIVMQAGQVVHAEVANLTGRDAFFALVQYHAGLYRFEPGGGDGPQTIQHQVSELLLESAIREDMARGGSAERVLEATITSTAAGLRELGIVRSSIDLRSRTALEARATPLAAVTARLGIAVADPYLLGDLVLAAAIGDASIPQFQIELWAARAEGVSAMLALASPPGHQVLAASLDRSAHNRLHLQFQTTQARVVVTLVDIESDSDVPERVPDGVILVPPRGELVSLAPQRLADVTGRLDQPHKLAIVALGGAALQSTLERLVDGTGVHYLHLSTRLDDLRDVIGRVIRLWNTNR